jgi:hypothetical protein
MNWIAWKILTGETFPVVFTSYSHATLFAPRERKLLSFVLDATNGDLRVLGEDHEAMLDVARADLERLQSLLRAEQIPLLDAIIQ